MWMIAALLLQAGPSPAPFTLVVGRDIAAPRKLAARPASYPPQAREHGVHGVVVLRVTVDERGRPVRIMVQRSVPILDQTAIDAVKSWVYAPTLVDGRPRPVEVIELMGFYASPAEKITVNTGLAGDPKEPVGLRLAAIAELVPAPPKQRTRVVDALTALSKDSNAFVSKAAARALEQLGSP